MQNDYNKNYNGQRFGRWLVLESTYSPTHWLCECECGLTKPVQKYSLLNGLSEGCKKCNNTKDRTLPRNTKWEDGHGYIIITAPKDYHGRISSTGRITKRRQIYEHLYVMTQHLGRPLRPFESVHHKNGLRSDNRIENLELWHTGQPAGQRTEDKINWCIEYLRQYAPHLLR